METICHGMLEGGSSIFQDKGHESIHKCAPWGCECRLIMVFFLDLDLVITEKPIHEGKYFMSSPRINDLIDERCGEFAFGTCPIEVVEVCANANGTLFFIHQNKIRNPSGDSSAQLCRYIPGSRYLFQSVNKGVDPFISGS